MRFRFISSLCLLVLFFVSSPARADLNADMNRFWNALGGSSNVTTATAFEGQAASYYTLGNVRARSPSRNTSLGSFRCPLLRHD